MLQIKNLTLAHKKDLRILVEDLSFSLNKGDKIAVIGEEGNGKSTLLKWIYNPLLVEDYMEAEGVLVKNHIRLGYLAQELSEMEKQKTVYDTFSEMEVFWEKQPAELAEIARKLGVTVDFFYREQTVGSLSGGEQVKLQLAGILLAEAEVLLLDEPSNDLDLETLVWLGRFIRESRQAILFISHDETLLEEAANGILHIEQLRRKTKPRHSFIKTTYREYVEGRSSQMTRQEQLANDQRRTFQKQQERFRQIEQRVAHEQRTISRQDPHGGRLLKKKMKTVKAMEKRFMREEEGFTELPETEEAIFASFDEAVSLPRGKRVLEYGPDTLTIGERVLAKDVRLNLCGGEKVCIIGKNGAGKTTLLRKIAQTLEERKDIRCFYMPQQYEEVLPTEQTPIAYLAESDAVAARQEARRFLGCMRYTVDEMEHGIGELSGGQKAKLFLLKMIREGCNVLLLDEPTRNFSPLSAPVIRSILKDFGGCILAVSHDRKFMDEVCDKVYRLEEDGLREMR